MIEYTERRPLEDLVADLASGLIASSEDAGAMMRATGVRPVSVEFNLPVETHVGTANERLTVFVDVPRTRTRTPFDLPIGRLTLRLVSEPTP